MKIGFVTTSIAGFTALALFASTGAPAAGNSVGEKEYQTRCAMCHGAAGKGDGWLAEFLMKRPRSLTQLKKNNGGVFPSASVNEIIIGRKSVSLHGPQEMPVWGDVYRVEQRRADKTEPGVPPANEQLIRAKIRALTSYISELQE
jgi:mono/diheme cytochrome c family protein